MTWHTAINPQQRSQDSASSIIGPWTWHRNMPIFPRLILWRFSKMSWNDGTPSCHPSHGWPWLRIEAYGFACGSPIWPWKPQYEYLEAMNQRLRAPQNTTGHLNNKDPRLISPRLALLKSSHNPAAPGRTELIDMDIYIYTYVCIYIYIYIYIHTYGLRVVIPDDTSVLWKCGCNRTSDSKYCIGQNGNC